jgi:predicted butyrate kinase (DUF1464 family)
MKVIGVDPGTKSFDIFGLKDGEICLDTSIPTDRVLKNPDLLIETISSQEPFDLLIAPSGFGLPIKSVKELTEDEIFELVLRKSHTQSTMGLQAVLRKIQTKDWNAVVIPGVKHLPTIPEFRKINKIDMGTADKVCAAVVGIRDMMELHQISCEQTNFIMLEIGSGFSAVLAIENGKIIDGIGGSNILGFQTCGALDGELAYLMGTITKKKIYQGGVASIIGFEKLGVDEILLLAQRDLKTQKALDAFIDSLTKAVFAISSSFKKDTHIQAILISGRLAYEKIIQEELNRRLEKIGQVRIMKSYAAVAKRAAQGATFIAEGFLSGKYSAIIENLELKHARGHVLDEIYVPLDPTN